MPAGKEISTDFKPILDFIKKYDAPAANRNLLQNLQQLKEANKTYSDVKSKDGTLQYIDLVQEGGGTLGVALVGYTFVLEYLGIRFLRLAGTSAGAINAIFLAAIGQKHEPKSPELFGILTNPDFNLFNFVDGNRFARFMIKSIVGKDGWFKRIFIFFITIAVLAFLILPLMNLVSKESVSLYFVCLAIFLGLTGFTAYQLMRFNKASFGINPGKAFLNDFLIKKLKEYGIDNSRDLSNKAEFAREKDIDLNNANNPLGLVYAPTVFNSPYNTMVNEILEKYKTRNRITASYSFVSADINNQVKVSFPEDAGLYWEKPAEVHPAKFVRASMAIPVFFEPYFSDPDKKPISAALLKEWETAGFDPKFVADYGIFIDGGSISNFPINKLHNPDVILARVPVLGSRLADSKSKKPGEMKSIFDYAGRIINTIRGQEDKTFLRKYNFYQKYSISEIAAFNTKISWLNFNLTDKDKAALFLEGVQTAITFLQKFDWNNYKIERMKIVNV